MRLPNNKKLLAMTTNEFATWVKQAVNRREFKILFQGIQIVCKKEIQSFLAIQNKFLQNFVNKNSHLYALAQIYPNIAPLIRQSIDNNTLSIQNLSMYNSTLDIISLIYVSSISDSPCLTFNCSNPRSFITKNKNNHTFWQWFRAHLPHNMKLTSYSHYNYPIEFVLPSIIISNPHDLQFYKVFCREIKRQAPDIYKRVKISSNICKKMIEHLKQKEAGIKPKPQAISMAEANNNILIADLLR